MINLQNEYKKAIKAKNIAKQQFISQLQQLFFKAKDKPPNELSTEAQFLLSIVDNLAFITKQEFEALVLSSNRKFEAPELQGLLKAS